MYAAVPQTAPKVSFETTGTGTAEKQSRQHNARQTSNRGEMTRGSNAATLRRPDNMLRGRPTSLTPPSMSPPAAASRTSGSAAHTTRAAATRGPKQAGSFAMPRANAMLQSFQSLAPSVSPGHMGGPLGDMGAFTLSASSTDDTDAAPASPSAQLDLFQPRTNTVDGGEAYIPASPGATYGFAADPDHFGEPAAAATPEPELSLPAKRALKTDKARAAAKALAMQATVGHGGAHKSAPVVVPRKTTPEPREAPTAASTAPADVATAQAAPKPVPRKRVIGVKTCFAQVAHAAGQAGGQRAVPVHTGAVHARACEPGPVPQPAKAPKASNPASRRKKAMKTLQTPAVSSPLAAKVVALSHVQQNSPGAPSFAPPPPPPPPKAAVSSPQSPPAPATPAASTAPSMLGFGASPPGARDVARAASPLAGFATLEGSTADNEVQGAASPTMGFGNVNPTSPAVARCASPAVYGFGAGAVPSDPFEAPVVNLDIAEFDLDLDEELDLDLDEELDLDDIATDEFGTLPPTPPPQPQPQHPAADDSGHADAGAEWPATPRLGGIEAAAQPVFSSGFKDLEGHRAGSPLGISPFVPEDDSDADTPTPAPAGGQSCEPMQQQLQTGLLCAALASKFEKPILMSQIASFKRQGLRDNATTPKNVVRRTPLADTTNDSDIGNVVRNALQKRFASVAWSPASSVASSCFGSRPTTPDWNTSFNGPM